MNWLHCFWGLGVTMSPMIMSAFLGGEGQSWRNGYVVVASLQLAIAFLVLVTLKKWRAEAPREEEKAPEKSFRELMGEKGIVTSVLSLGLYCAGESLLGTWGATYAVNALSLAPEVAAKWVSLYYGGIMAGRVVSGFVSMKFSDNWLIRGGMAAAAVGMAVLALPMGEMALVGLFLIGFGYGPVFPSVLHSVPARFGVEYSADITGYHMGSAYFIGLAAQVGFGLLATAVGFAITPFVLLIFCAGVLVANEMTVKCLRK
jgi:fucose permease